MRKFNCRYFPKILLTPFHRLSQTRSQTEAKHVLRWKKWLSLLCLATDSSWQDSLRLYYSHSTRICSHCGSLDPFFPNIGPSANPVMFISQSSYVHRPIQLCSSANEHRFVFWRCFRLKRRGMRLFSPKLLRIHRPKKNCNNCNNCNKKTGKEKVTCTNNFLSDNSLSVVSLQRWNRTATKTYGGIQNLV